MNVLFTSTDPGSAQQNNSVAYMFNKYENYKLAYISSHLSSKFYSSNYNNSLVIEDRRNLKKKLSDFIDAFIPDFIFLGLSANKNEIDYLACEIAKEKNVKTAAIQDYYGWIGAFDSKIKPNYFFVIDEYAKKLTQDTKICNSKNIIILGSPKHHNYLNQLKSWDKDIQNINFANRELIFFLQPLHIPGIESNFINFCKSINQINPGYKLNVKPHPLDENSDILEKISNKYPIEILHYNKSVELLLLYFENIVNCFSTIAYDYYFLTNYLKLFEAGNLYNLLIGKEIIKSIEALNFDITKTPQYEVGINITNAYSLEDELNCIFNSTDLTKKKYKTFVKPKINVAEQEIANLLKRRME